MRYGIDESYWEEIKSVLSQFPKIKKAILFGSRAKGNNIPFSDVDISLVGEDLQTTDLLKVHTKIDDLLLPYEFDFCIYNKIENQEFKSHIDRRGIVVYTNEKAV